MKARAKTCERIRELMSHALEDTLSPKDRSLFEDHMRVCSHCQRVWVHYRFIVRTLSQLPREPFNFFAEQRLLKRIALVSQGSSSEERSALLPWRFALLGMGVAGVLFLFILVTPSPSSAPLRLFEARTNPRPEIFLRDTKTGSWLRPFEVVNYWMKGEKPIRILPRLNSQHPRAEEEYRNRMAELKESFERIFPGMAVEFLPPQAITTPRAEPVEFWIVSGGEVPPQ